MCSLHNLVWSGQCSDHLSAPYSIYVEKGEKCDKVLSESFSLRSNSEFSVTPRNLTPGVQRLQHAVDKDDSNRGGLQLSAVGHPPHGDRRRPRRVQELPARPSPRKQLDQRDDLVHAARR